MEENNGPAYYSDKNKKDITKARDEGMEPSEYKLIPIGEIIDEDSEKRLDLFSIATVIWDERKKIISLIIAFFIIGLFIYLIKPDTYSTKASLLPEATNNPNGSNNSLYQQFSGFFNSNSGIGGQENLSITLYPKIVQSLPFELELIRQPLYFSSLDTTISLYTYYTKFARPDLYTYLKHYTVGSSPLEALMFFPRNRKIGTTDTTFYNHILNKKYILHTAHSKIRVAAASSALININNTPDGITEISGYMPDPAAAADLVSVTTQLLTKYVTNYRVNKAKNDMEFIQSQTDSAYQQFVNAQDSLDTFNDSNTNLVSDRARSKQTRLQANYNLALGLYQNLVQQLDQAKIKVQKQTPVFTTLEPAKIPSGKKVPNLIEVIAGSLFLGFFFGCVYIYINNKYPVLLKRWKEYRRDNAS